ncbi:MAG: HAMP domain-containing protein [Proteobacteria bacterium]|nr:HAMP domain-containing protein [Pseudomonadota bacterium]
MKRKIFVATALVAAVTLVSGLVIAFGVTNRAHTASADELSRQARVTAKLIEEDLDEIRFRPGGNAPAQIARARSSLERSLVRARVLGDHDIVEAVLTVRSRTVPISEPLVLIPLLPSEVAEGDVVSVDVQGASMLVAVENVESEFGTLTVAIAREEPLFPARGLTIALLVALGVGAMLTIALGYWFSASLSKRLDKISAVADRVGSGDLAARAPVKGDDEIDQLSASFNSMASDLQASGDREREFLMAVSHDLRTPLTTISGYAEALDAGDIPPDDLSRVAGVLHAQTRQLSRLIDDILALARLEASEFTLRPVSIDVTGLVDGTVDTYADRARAANISIRTLCHGSHEMVVDPDRLVQILGNLLDNALRYTPHEGEILVTCSGADEGSLDISVRNTGEGINLTDIPHVFERLYVADRYRAVRPAGSGLGLAIVAELVDAMGGRVRCTSDEGATTFTVTI